MIRLLTGANEYEVRNTRKLLITQYATDKGTDAITIVDGASITIDELPQLLMGTSLFAARRMVVLDNADSQKSVWEKLVDYLPQVGDDMEILLLAPSADKRTKIYKWLQKNVTVQSFEPLNDSQLLSWLSNKARAIGIDLNSENARYMIEFTSGDQWQLANDLQKLKLHGHPITPDVIRDILIPNPQASAFELLDAALAGRVQALDQLLEGVRTREDPYRFFGLLSNQVFAITAIAAAGNRSPDTIAKDLGLHPFVVRKTQPIAKRLNIHKRERLVQITATTDMQLKSTGTEPWVLLTAALKSIAA